MARAHTPPGAAPGTADLPADTERLLRACAGISSIAETALTDALASASPFVPFGVKARLRGLAAPLEPRRNAEAVVIQRAAEGPAPTGAAAASSISLEEIDRIVAARVDAAMSAWASRLGLGGGEAVPTLIDARVSPALGAVEARVMDHIRRQIDEALDLFQSTLDERFQQRDEGEARARAEAERQAEEAQQEQAEARAEVERRVEEAREALLKDIDEVRTVDVGFNIDSFAADMASAMAEEGFDEGGELDADGSLDEELIDGGDEAGVELAEEHAEEAQTEPADSLDPEEAVEPTAPAVETLPMPASQQVDVAPFLDVSEIEEISSVDELGSVEPELIASAHIEPIQNSPASDELEELDAEPISSPAVAFEEEIAVSELQSSPAIELDLDSGQMEPFGAGEDASLSTAEVEMALHDGGLGENDIDVEMDIDGGIEDSNRVELDIDVQIDPGAAGGMDLEVALDDGAAEVSAEAVNRYLQRASEMRLRKQTAAAMELYNKVLDMDNRNYEAHIGRGVLHLESRDFKRAADEFTLAEELDNTRPAAALGLAEVHFHRKQFNKAIRYYSQCLTLDDRLAQAYCNRGLSLYYQKNYKKAFLDLMRAYELDPELPNIRKYLKLVKNKVKAESESGPTTGDSE